MNSNRQCYRPERGNNNDDSSFEDDGDILDEKDMETLNICSRSIVLERIYTSDYDDDLYWDADFEDTFGERRVDSNRFPRPWLRRRDRNTIRSLLTCNNSSTTSNTNTNNDSDDDDDNKYNIVPEITYAAPTTATRLTQHSNEYSRKRKRPLVDNCRF